MILFSSKCTTLYLTLYQKPRWGESVTRGFSLQLSSLCEPDTSPSPPWISNHGHCSVVFTRVSVHLTFTLLLLSMHSVSVHVDSTFLLTQLLIIFRRSNKILTIYGWASAIHHCQCHRNHPNRNMSICVKPLTYYQWISFGLDLVILSCIRCFLCPVRLSFGLSSLSQILQYKFANMWIL